MRRGNLGLIVGASFAALVLAAIAWMFFIKPRLDATTQARSELADTRATNDDLRERLGKLKDEEASLPEYRERIYEVRDDLPPQYSVATERAYLSDIFARNNLVVFSDQVGQYVEMSGDPGLASAAEAAGVPDPGADLDFSGLIGTPVVVTTAGTLDDVFAAIDDLQSGDDHPYYLVTDVKLNPVSGNDKVNGISLETGDVEVELTFYFFTLDFGDNDIETRPIELPYPGDGGDLADIPTAFDTTTRNVLIPVTG